jgi:pimeloyl-ACP methyl ester carboxylesterase
MVGDGGVTRSRLLLVHGWGADRGSWQRIGELVAPWADVVAPDLPGHGSRTQEAGPFTVGALVSDLAGLISSGEPVVAVGHSMGGQVVALLAVRHPELVRSIVVIDPAYGADDAEIEQSPDVLADLRARGATAGVEFVDGAFAAFDGGPLQSAIRAQMACTPGVVLADLYESMYLAPGSFGHRPATREFLAGLGRPCLSLYSTESAADFARSLQWPTGSVVEVWPGTSHYLHQEYPKRFAELLRGWIT